MICKNQVFENYSQIGAFVERNLKLKVCDYITSTFPLPPLKVH